MRVLSRSFYWHAIAVMTNQSHAKWLREGREKPRVVVLAPRGKRNVQEALRELHGFIEQHCELLAVDEEFKYSFESCKEDLVVVLGGDGSILQAARQMAECQRPVVGVNFGRLGFLAALSCDRFKETWPKICGGDFAITDHLMLNCEVLRDDKTIARQIGLNEAAVLGGPPYAMLQIDLYVDSDLATTYACDGLIVSTPVGSTAHNLSAGGPILRKNLQAFVVSPISPHTLTMRPVVDTADRVFELVLSDENASATVVVDGRVVCPYRLNDKIRIRRADATFQLVSVAGQDDYAALRDKLGWGGVARGKRL